MLLERIKISILLSFLFLSLYSFKTNAHDFYFSFCELEYKEIGQQMEATLSVTTHDFEIYLEKNGFKSKHIETIVDSEKKLLEQLINDRLSLIVNTNQNIYFTIEGIECQLTGISLIYLNAAAIKSFDNMTITYDLMMDYFPEQQNKLTFIYRDKKYTFVFLQNSRNAELKLEH